jgi:hydrogenase maturation protein HypF
VREDVTRVRILIRGAVQGVGFRPFIYRLATAQQIRGWVANSPDGIIIEGEAAKPVLDEFLLRTQQDLPPRASIHSLEFSFLDKSGYSEFTIRSSETSGAKNAVILPDIATCGDCLKDIFDSSNRRYLYPFTNCTNCGPRFTIVERIPYDRANTTMRSFTMCAACQAEYDDPADRRFHAQPNACATCGPHLETWDCDGKWASSDADAVRHAVDAIRQGLVVAVKGLGGFHLLVDATNEAAVNRLRTRKLREEKPFALMAPTLEAVRCLCEMNSLEERALTGPEAPIVLLLKRSGCPIAESVSPRNPNLGVMLPYTPLHHILMHHLKTPVVATSGNRTDEPIAIDEYEALRRLQGIADVFLVHNRPIRRHADDSIVRIILGGEQVLRRARGYAPFPILLRHPVEQTLAVGGQLKNTLALADRDRVFISQHIGDLGSREAFEAFRRTIDDFADLYGAVPGTVAGDLHPDYASASLASQIANSRGIHFVRVQHHFAHVLACIEENAVDFPALGVAWDGTGYGSDGTIWGGEFLLAHDAGFDRVAHFRTFPLPGGDAAARNPKQTATGLLYEMLKTEAFTGEEPPLLRQMLEKQLRSPRTSSAGRLFDAVAYLIGLTHHVSFEGQAAMQLEFAVTPALEDSYPWSVTAGEPLVIDWEPMIRCIIDDRRSGVSSGTIAAKFHNTLADIIVDIAQRVGQRKVVLTGGCFQNRYLTERAVRRLSEAGFRPYWHQRVPPNDGGIALGQIIAASRQKAAARIMRESCV